MPSTPPPGWRTYHYGLFARITILLGGNCKTYVINCSWWIHWVSKNRPLLEDHVNAISKHVCDTMIFNKNIWSPMLNVSWSVIRTPLYGNVLNNPRLFIWMFVYLLSYPVCHVLLLHGKDILLLLVLNHNFLSIVLINVLITFSFPLFCLTFLIYMI